MVERAVPIGNTYDKYASKNPIEKRLLAGFMNRLDSLLPASATRILEVGVGEGELIERLRTRYPQASITGLDLPDEGLREQWARRDVEGFFADAEALPFPSKSFDLVIGIEMLEHVRHPDRVLAEMARVGAGSFVVSVPLEPWWRAANMARGAYLKDLGNTPGHINHWSKTAFTRLVDNHLAVTRSTMSFPWTLVGATSRGRR